LSNTPLVVTSQTEIKLIPKVKTFLESVSRNSKGSERAYAAGLVCFDHFLKEKYPKYNLGLIVESINKNEINIYELFDNFVAFLVNSNLSVGSIRIYVAAIRSYFGYYDIDIIPSKFKRKVKMPRCYREDEEPIDVNDIRNILLHCNNRRLKTYLLVLGSGGMRAVEALAIRLKDIDFSVSPTKIHVRKEYAKTRVSRDIYISDEGTDYLKQWIEWKYRDKGDEWTRVQDPDDLVFSVYRVKDEADPTRLYYKVIAEFQNLLAIVGLDERKEEGKQKRRKITLHSFRRFVKTVISDQTNQDYSEWFLGHSKSPYYTKKEAEKREIYATKCMRYLTFLDYTMLESAGKNIEAKLSEKEKEIHLLRQRDSLNSDAIASLSDQLAKVMQEIEIMKNRQNNVNSISRYQIPSPVVVE
jgi:integrase